MPISRVHFLTSALIAFPLAAQSGGGGQADPEKCERDPLSSFASGTTTSPYFEGEGQFTVSADNPVEDDTYRGECKWSFKGCNDKSPCLWDYDLTITIDGPANTFWEGRVTAPDGDQLTAGSQLGGAVDYTFLSDEISADCRTAPEETYLAEVKVYYFDGSAMVWSDWTEVGYALATFPCDRCHWQAPWTPPAGE